ncbi:MAG: TerB family tellurite resistance protein [Bacteroidota bacterium]
MKNTDKLYEAFGELLYCVAMADGAIQTEEVETIERRLSDHPWGEDIKWSFDYEVKKNNSLEELYKKVITYCEMHGPEKEYQFLINLLTEVAAASSGIEKSEQEVIDNFVSDLTEKFKTDIERINSL